MDRQEGRWRGHRFAFVILTLVALGPLAAPAVAATSPDEAAKFVAALAAEATALEKGGQVPDEKRLDAFEALLRRGFAVELIGRYVLGDAWSTAAASARDEYVRLLATWLLESRVLRLGGDARAGFRIVGSAPAAANDALVVTELVRAHGPPLEVGWRVRAIDGELKIVDLLVERVSLSITARQAFRPVVKREGLDALIRELKARVDRLEARRS